MTSLERRFAAGDLDAGRVLADVAAERGWLPPPTAQQLMHLGEPHILYDSGYTLHGYGVRILDAGDGWGGGGPEYSEPVPTDSYILTGDGGGGGFDCVGTCGTGTGDPYPHDSTAPHNAPNYP